MSIEHYEHEHPLDIGAIERAQGSENEKQPETAKTAEEEPAETTGSRK
jgi:hypothetical protein